MILTHCSDHIPLPLLGPDAKVVFHYLTYTLVEELGTSYNKVIKLVQQHVATRGFRDRTETSIIIPRAIGIESKVAVVPSKLKPSELRPPLKGRKSVVNPLKANAKVKAPSPPVPKLTVPS